MPLLAAEKEESNDLDRYRPPDTERDVEASTAAATENSQVADQPSARQQALLGNRRIASQPFPLPSGLFRKGVGNSVVARMLKQAADVKAEGSDKRRKPGKSETADAELGSQSERASNTSTSATSPGGPPTSQPGLVQPSGDQPSDASMGSGQGRQPVEPLGAAGPNSSESVFHRFTTASASEIAAQIGVSGQRLQTQFQHDRQSFEKSSPGLRVCVPQDIQGEKRAAVAAHAAPKK
ncbi:MAG: hypothetical protein AAGG44_17500, partial [Planctomycetota bacterium]